MIYLDNNATTRPAAEVVASMREMLEEHWANPSSVHRAGQAARARVELARQSVARLIGAKPRDIVFTSGATESIDLAIRGVLAARAKHVGAGRVAIVTTAVEHEAVRDLCKALADDSASGLDVRLLPLDSAGRVRVEALAGLLDESVALVSVQWANNETGVIHPIEEIGRVCRERKIPFHCDGTQWVGKMPTVVDAEDARGGGTPIDLLSFSAHKMHGPKGVGALYVRQGVKVVPRMRGVQERERRGGTENTAGIVGFGVASELAMAWLARSGERERLAGLRDRLERGVLESVAGTVVNGREFGSSEKMRSGGREVGESRKPSPCPLPEGEGADGQGGCAAGGSGRLWNTTNIAFPKLEAEALLLLLSEAANGVGGASGGAGGVCASAGAACSSGSLDPSPVLLAMGVEPALAHGSVRFSLSRETTGEEIESAIGIIARCAAKLGGSATAVR
ncbi:MAG TPA: cysteine desulfurase family protein [Phycisphaerales bacterium]|nr:cysteine desulfurase family protein [Phycisphaerales bacterium]